MTAGDYALLIDTDTDFSSGATVHTTGASITSGILSFTGVSFSDGDYFAVAVQNLVSPGGGELKLWLRADAGVTGATPVTAWADQSGNGNNATAGTGPDLVSDQLNFNPTLDFTSASSEYLQITNGILGTYSYDDIWVYYVAQTDAIQTNTIFNENLASSEYLTVKNPWSDNNAYIRFGDGGYHTKSYYNFLQCCAGLLGSAHRNPTGRLKKSD